MEPIEVKEGRAIVRVGNIRYYLEPLTTLANLTDCLRLVQEFELYGQYLAGRAVFDIGAGNGLSSILAIHYGAKRVIAVEPMPFYYNALLTTIQLNGLGNKITPVLAAVGSNRGKIKAPGHVMPYAYLAYSMGSMEVDAITLCDLVSTYAPNTPTHGLALIADCEGCEWTFDCLDLFEVAVVEWHGRDIDMPDWEVIADRGMVIKSLKKPRQ